MAVAGIGPLQPLSEPKPNDGQVFCSACAEHFQDIPAFQTHSKTERHVYNSKRKLQKMKPISQELWDRKHAEATAIIISKGKDHLKVREERKRKVARNKRYCNDADPPSPRRCLFDRRHFETVEDCLAYMRKKYTFFIPDQEYCTDIEGFLLFLRQKIEEPPHRCICCNSVFRDAVSVRMHMSDLCHTHLASEAFSRSGKPSQEKTEILQEELEAFYDFEPSILEIMDNFDSRQKVGVLLRFFDADRDGHLNKEEIAALWEVVDFGFEFDMDVYRGVCRKVNADPDVGLDINEFRELYKQGLADLNEHFDIIREKLKTVRKRKKVDTEIVGLDKIDEGDTEECDDDVVSELSDDAGNDADDHSGEEDDSEVEVLECEDDDEFEEAMRILGLEVADITDSGDLRLPNGNVAVHRCVAYLYKQRGRRFDSRDHPVARKAISTHKSHLMLANAPAGTRFAVSKHQVKSEGRRVVAMLRAKNWHEVKLGIKQGMLQKNRICKTRSVRGDASGAGGAGR